MDVYIKGPDADIFEKSINPMAAAAGLTLHLEEAADDAYLLTWDKTKYYLKKNQRSKEIDKPCSILKLMGDLQKWGSADQDYQMNDWAYDSLSKTIHASGKQPQELRDKEADILVYFIKNPNRLIAKEELLSNVWGYKSGLNTRTIETHIYRLRQKLEKITGKTYLATDHGGYRFVTNL